MTKILRTLGTILAPMPCIVAAFGLLSARSIGADKQTSNADGLRARVEKRVQAWQPTKEERRLDEIGWAKDIRDALRLARQHRRPVFFFSYSGTTDRPQAMATQRC